MSPMYLNCISKVPFNEYIIGGLSLCLADFFMRIPITLERITELISTGNVCNFWKTSRSDVFFNYYLIPANQNSSFEQTEHNITQFKLVVDSLIFTCVEDKPKSIMDLIVILSCVKNHK